MICNMCDAPAGRDSLCDTCREIAIQVEEDFFNESNDYPDDYAWEFYSDEGDPYAGTYSEM